MGTRSGDIDPSIVEVISEKENMNVKEVLNVLNKKSGVLGLSEVSSDFRDITKAIEEGNITVDDIAKSVGEDVVIIKEKLCGKEDFIINEAMTINVELFPDIPFKTLFSHYKND